MRQFIFWLLFLSACTPPLPNAADITPVTAIPTVDDVTLCAIGQDVYASWDRRLSALETIHDRNRDCGTDSAILLYLRYVEFGVFMEDAGEAEAARDAYHTALFYYPDGQQAQERLEALTPLDVTEEIEGVCDDGTMATLPDYHASDGHFASLNQQRFEINGEDYFIYGVNYYPRDTPFDRFLVETALDDVEFEFGVIRQTGLNTLRIFLYPAQLFVCDAVVPNVEVFETLDGLIHLANENELRLIVVLHQGIDADALYGSNQYIRQQTGFIIERYRDEPAILAWDVRDSGDFDTAGDSVAEVDVLRWLADTVLLIRSIDDKHFITAGWQQNSVSTASLVDFVSFQSYGDIEALRQEIANLRARANRPILLSAIGYSTFDVSDVVQRDNLFRAFEAVDYNGLMGWMVYQAFDFPRTVTCTSPNCPSEPSAVHQYGLWNTGYFPKLAIEAIQFATGASSTP